MRFSDPVANIERFNLEHGSLVADFGAGTGEYTMASARAVGRRGVVYAVDIQQELLSRIKNTANNLGLENVETVWGDIESFGGSGLLDNTVDAAVVSNVLFLVEDKDELVKEIIRVLKYNGKVLVVDWKDSFGGLGPHADAIVSLQVVKDLFEKHGFDFIKEIQAGAHHYGAVFKGKK
ncbi:MAG: methyltransferase domain-containing protein [Candidatus Paceibacterota bacterium]